MCKIRKWNKWLLYVLAIFLLITFIGYKSTDKETPAESSNASISIEDTGQVEKGLSYSTRNEVAQYIHEFLELPPNYISKKEARDLGWDSSKGNLWQITNKKSIGGDRFGNREGLLPEADTRIYYECDINYKGGYRGAERIVYSNDGLIFYTDDHYKTFKKLY